tara:strand:+ start:392 stop:511 length:120 start_codon:yes stop_codon:yes gene_type:complete
VKNNFLNIQSQAFSTSIISYIKKPKVNQLEEESEVIEAV